MFFDGWIRVGYKGTKQDVNLIKLRANIKTNSTIKSEKLASRQFVFFFDYICS